MKKGKFLYRTNIKDFKTEDNTTDIEFSVYGIFDTDKVLWSYYVISSIGVDDKIILTPHLCKNLTANIMATHDRIRSYTRSFNTKEDGINFIKDFKDKWEYGSNDTRQEKRDQKIDDILDEEK